MALTDDRLREIHALLEKGDEAAALQALRSGATAPVAPVAGGEPAPASQPAPANPAPLTVDPTTPAPASQPTTPQPAPTDPAQPAPVAPAGQVPAPAPAAPVAPMAPVVPQVAAAGVPAGFHLVDSATLEQINRIAEADRTRQVTTTLAGAARAGKVTPATLPTWKEALERDFTATASLLQAQPAVFPTFELGHAEGVAAAAAAEPAQDEAWDAFIAALDA